MKALRTAQSIQHTPSLLKVFLGMLSGRFLCLYALAIALFCMTGMLAPSSAMAQPLVQNKIETSSKAASQPNPAEPHTNSTEEGARNAEHPPLTPNDSDKQGYQGCCSYHGGICGQTPAGELLCCDGAISPTCDL